MNADQDAREELIWATGGRSWGFRFLLDGGLADPLPEYERVFAGLDDEPTGWTRVAASVGLRFLDPLGRRDSSGRVIPHEFTVLGSLADEIESADDGQQQVWPLVASAYARVWDADAPPSAEDLDFTPQDDSPIPP